MQPIDYVKAQDLILSLQNAEIEEANTIAIRDEANKAIPGLAAHIEELKAEIRSILSPIMTDEPAEPVEPEEQPELIFQPEPQPAEPEEPAVVVDEDVPLFEDPQMEADAASENYDALEDQAVEEPVSDEPASEPVIEDAVEEPIAQPVEVAPVEEATSEEVPTASEEMLAEMDAEEVPAETVAEETPIAETPVAEEEPIEEASAPEYDGDPGNGTEEMISFSLFPMAPYDYNREFHPILTSRDGLNFTFDNVTVDGDDITFRMLPAQGTSGGLLFENQKNRGWRDGTYITNVKTPAMKPGMVAVPLALISDGGDAFGYTGENEHKFAIELIGSGLVRFTLDNGDGPVVLRQAAYSWGHSELHCEIARVNHTTAVEVHVHDITNGETVLAAEFDKTTIPEGVRWPFDVPMHPVIIYTADEERWNSADPTAYDFTHPGYAILKEPTHNPAAS